MSLTWDVGAFIAGVAVALLWLIRLIVTQQLGNFQIELIAKLDLKYYSADVARLEQRDLERRLDSIEARLPMTICNLHRPGG